ncbi:E2F-associated phosphoprotein-like [Mucor ambiguus]|uniref:E2F-associated phosphoprotein-like n=1 Tax=Mucor ambiguus TaxID=91626 RepID=A0A0C9LTU1_9FUNG|nr:E2F-associated phosphoprotein-like [Mucor ambiguus]
MEPKAETNLKEELYDEVYFDSDQESDQEETIGLGLPGQSKNIQDDSMRSNEEGPLDDKTDAILSCPMCFTTLCYSCQRHEKYADQFRAMFVRNCHTVPGERYKMKGDDDSDEYFYKVICDTCGIQVAMLDEDEVYHFFNVVAASA